MNLSTLLKKLKQQAADGFSVARAGIVTDTQAKYPVPLESLRVTGTGAALGAVAGTPAGAFGLTYGAYGTNSPKILGEAASGASKTDKFRFTKPLPPEYVDGANVTVRVHCKEAVGAATISTTVSCLVRKSDKETGVGSNICATSGQDVTTAYADKDFAVTPTGLVRGDILDIEVTGMTDDTGGTVGTVLTISDVEVLMDIKG